jgi:DNA-binding response OmpR family regulator
MFTSSAAQRTRNATSSGSASPSGSASAAAGDDRSGVIVQLELPGRGRDAEVSGGRPPLDPLELANAVRGLIHAIAPDLPAEVRVEFGSPVAPSPAPAPALASAGVSAAAGSSTPAPEGRPVVHAVPLDRFDHEPDDPPESPDPALSDQTSEDFRLDLVGRTLTVDGKVVVLTRREFDLLAYLRNRRGAAVTRRELMSGVWQTGYLSGDRTIDVHIRRLRMKLGSHAGRLATLRGYGYRLD